MRTFAQFVAEATTTAHKPRKNKKGIPVAIVDFPARSVREKYHAPRPHDQKKLKEDFDSLPQITGLKPLAPLHSDGKKDVSHWYSQNENEHLGRDHIEVGKKLSSTAPTSEEDQKHLTKYTAGSSQLNRHLYEKHLNGALHDPHVEADEGGTHDVHALHKAAYHPVGHELHVYSGVRFHPGDMAASHPEGHVHLPAFTSTTVDKGTAAVYAQPKLSHNDSSGIAAKHVLHIHMKPEDHGVYVAHHSHFDTEREMVLPKGTTLKIHPHPEKYGNSEFQSASDVHVWHAHIVHQDHPDTSKPHEWK